MRHSAVLLLTILSLASIATVGSAAQLPPEKDRWIEITTENFTFYSNAGEKMTRTMVTDLEEFRSVLVGISTGGEHNPLPISVYIFKSDQSFTPYKHLNGGRPAAATGYFLRRNHANYIAIDGSARRPSGVVYHEFVHYFASINLPALPLWFEEGLAEVYQTFEINGRKATIGLPIFEHVYQVMTSSTMTYDELFAVDHGSPQYTEEHQKGAFYSQSWAVVHYLLLSSEQRRAETQQFISLLHDGVLQGDAFRSAYTVEVDQLDLELSRYLSRPSLPVISLTVAPRTATEMAVREMSYSEVLFRLGDLLMNQQRPRPEVMDHFRVSLEHDPNNGQTLSALGLLAEDRAQWDDARSYHERAIENAPNDSMVLFRAGSFLLQRGDDVERARDLLRESTRLAPSFAPAWVALTGSFMAAGDVSSEALTAAETAHALLPSRIDVSASLLRLYLRNDRRQDAVSLINTALSQDRSENQLAWGIVAREDLNRAREFLRLGQPDEALDAASRAVSAARRTPDAHHLNHQAEIIRSNVYELQVATRYNRAVAAYNEGDVAGAREILVGLSGEELPGRHADAVRSFLEFIDDPDSPPLYDPSRPRTTQVFPSDIDRLNTLIASGQLDEALELLETFKDRSGSDQRSWIDAKIEEIRFIRDHNRFAETYNQAISQYNGGAYAAAVKTLETLLAEQPDAEEADKARELLAEARSRL